MDRSLARGVLRARIGILVPSVRVCAWQALPERVRTFAGKVKTELRGAPINEIREERKIETASRSNILTPDY